MTQISEFAAAITPEQLWHDPYPIYERMRAEGVEWIPALNCYLVSRYEDVLYVEKHPEIFSAEEPEDEPTPASRAIGGVSVISTDGDPHARLRRAAESALRPNVIKKHWIPTFQQNADSLIDKFVAAGAGDLYEDFAAPLSVMNLNALLGLRGVPYPELQVHSQNLVAAGGNVADDPEVWARCAQTNEILDVSIEATIEAVKRDPDNSIVSAMVHAEDPLSVDEIKRNLKVFIGGGINEPRDAILLSTYGLLSNPDQLRDVLAQPDLWKQVFEEAVRWVAPLSVYFKRIATPTTLGGQALKQGDLIVASVASANRDESMFVNADVFDIHRPKVTHLSFGSGAHFCMGAWASRLSIGQVALPTLFRRLPNLQLAGEVPFEGWAFRGPTRLDVTWTPPETS